MKILLVNDYATPKGGAEILISSLRDQLRRQGHDARIFSSSARSAGYDLFSDYQCLGTTTHFRAFLQTANPWAYFRLRQALETFLPDVVHVNLFLTQLSPLILPLLKGLPSLYHAHWLRTVCPTGIKMMPDGRICRVPAGYNCCRNGCVPLPVWPWISLQMKLWRLWRHVFNKIIAVSHTVGSGLIEEGIGPVQVIWSGVPTQPLRPPLSSPPTAAFAGRLVWEKGADILVKAFAKILVKIPDAQLILAGDGPDKSRIKKLASDLGISSHISIKGHLPQPEMERIFASSWLQVLPSRCVEGLALVALEAMMRGTAVIASALGGPSEIIQNGITGLLLPPGDVDALAAALLRLLKDREFAERIGRTGRKFALSHFRESDFVNRLVELYKDLCKGRTDTCE